MPVNLAFLTHGILRRLHYRAAQSRADHLEVAARIFRDRFGVCGDH